jgi:hypothetical protein
MATIVSMASDMCTIRFDDYDDTITVPQGVMIMPQFASARNK